MSIKLIVKSAAVGICAWLLMDGGWVSAQIVDLPEYPRMPESLGGAQRESATDLQRADEVDFPYGQVQTAAHSGQLIDRLDRNRLYYSSIYGERGGSKFGNARLEFPQDLLQGGLKYNSPLRTGVAPTNSDLTIGPLNLKLLSVSGSLLYTDNKNRDEFDRKGGFINMEEFDILGILQLTDRLRFSFKAGLIWFPLEGDFGLAGFTRDRFGGRLFYGHDPYLDTRFSYRLEVGEWNIKIYDNLRALQMLFADSFDFVGGVPFDEEDRIGRYAFRSSIRPREGATVNETTRDAFIMVMNTAGGSVDRLLPTVTRFEGGFYHTDFLFYYGSGGNTQLPGSRDVGYVHLSSERETMRFKPFADFRVSRYDEGPWGQRVQGGFSGPFTENIHFYGRAGYFWQEQSKKERVIAEMRLRHTIGPNTYHQIRYLRDETYPELDLANSYIYRFHQVLGPYVTADAYASYSTFEDLNGNNTGTEEWRAGLHLKISPSPRTTFRMGGIYSRVNYENPAIGRIDKWTAIGQISRTWGESHSLETILTYQFQDRDASNDGNTYYENLFVFTVNYYFGKHIPNSIVGDTPFERGALRGGAGGGIIR